MERGYSIPFNRPCLAGNELQYITQVIEYGHTSGDGAYTRKCQLLLEQALGVPRVLLTTSCTHALEMAALLLDIRPGDEVIVPSFTFVSTVNAFVLRGARPIFIDIRPDTLNLDETRLERLITPRTKAIVPVHYAGVGCELDAIMEIAERHDIAVVEDNAHGLFGKYKGKYLGTFGCLATQSFHETKNFTCGEGGALLINDPQYISTSSERRSSVRKVRIVAAFSAVRWTNIPGWTSVPAICRRTSWLHFCMPNWRHVSRFRSNGAGFGNTTTNIFGIGRRSMGCGFPLYQQTVSSRITCSICSCLI